MSKVIYLHPFSLCCHHTGLFAVCHTLDTLLSEAFTLTSSAWTACSAVSYLSYSCRSLLRDHLHSEACSFPTKSSALLCSPLCLTLHSSALLMALPTCCVTSSLRLLSLLEDKLHEGRDFFFWSVFVH